MKKLFFLVKFGFSRCTPATLLMQGRTHEVKLTGNPLYTTPEPSLAVLKTTCDELETAIAAYQFNKGRSELVARNVAFENLKIVIMDLGGYVQRESKGILENIESAGFDVRRVSSPIGELPAPMGLIARTTQYPGRIDVRWGGVPGRLMYDVQWCAGDPKVEANWKRLLMTSNNRYSLTGLESNATYFFRVYALGVAGMSPVSDVCSAKAA